MLRPPCLIYAAILACMFPICAFGSRDFEGMSCVHKDFSASLVGRKMSNEKVVVTEKKYALLRLEHLGADMLGYKGISSWVAWRLCDQIVIMLLDDKSVVSDAVQIFENQGKRLIPTLSCNQQNGAHIEDVIAVLNKSPLVAGNVDRAWQIDFKKKKLVEIPSTGMVCPTSP